MNHLTPNVIPGVISSGHIIAFQVQVALGRFNGKVWKGKSQGFGGARGQNRVCTQCNMTNHTIETCLSSWLSTSVNCIY